MHCTSLECSGTNPAVGRSQGGHGSDQAWPTWQALTGLLSVHFQNSTTSSHKYICPLISLNCVFVYLPVSIFVEFLEIAFPCVCPADRFGDRTTLKNQDICALMFGATQSVFQTFSHSNLSKESKLSFLTNLQSLHIAEEEKKTFPAQLSLRKRLKL